MNTLHLWFIEMRYGSGLDREDIKLYFLRQFFIYSVLISSLVLIPLLLYSPSLIVDETVSIIVFFFLLSIVLFIGSYLFFLNNPFAGIGNVLLRHEMSDYNVEVDNEKITIEYSYLTREGLRSVRNTLYLEDIVSIEPDVKFCREFNTVQRWKISNGYQFTNLPPGALFNPIIDRRIFMCILYTHNIFLRRH